MARSISTSEHVTTDVVTTMVTTTPVTPSLVELCHVSKAFGPTRALDDVSFDVMPGEVHVLAGENGAGKSTLIRILSGVSGDFEGELLVSGKRARFRDARDAAAA